MGQKYKTEAEQATYPVGHTIDVVQDEPGMEINIRDIPAILVRRQELHRWVNAVGLPSAYSFAPVGAHANVQTAAPETQADRNSRWLNWFKEEERINKRGALARVVTREQKNNPNAPNRSTISRAIEDERKLRNSKRIGESMTRSIIRPK